MDLDAAVPSELIVVDNGSSDDTADVVASIAQAAPLPVTYLLETRKGVSFAKNRGLAASCGELILFTDDDCIVRRDWLAAAIRLFASNPGGVFGGRVELHNPADLPITIKTSLKPGRLCAGYDVPGFLHGCNMVFCRAVLDRIGQFDTRFGPGSPLHAAEDTDLIYRGYLAGFSVTYEPDLVVRHDHGRSTWAAYKRLAGGYKSANGAMAMKYLLTGDTSLAKGVYWTMRTGFRNWRAGRIRRDEFVLDARYFWGALRYIASTIASRGDK
jgi:glycosyltransferase involved in cell wall biosynthesis